MSIQRFLSDAAYSAAMNALNPSAVNPFATELYVDSAVGAASVTRFVDYTSKSNIVGDYTGTVNGEGSTLRKFSGWTQQTAENDIDLNTISAISDDVAFMFGSYVSVKTIDGGKNWVNIAGFDSLMLYGSHFRGSQLGWVCGGSSVIKRTIDGGNTWLTGTGIVSTTFNDIFFVTDLIGWAVGNSGKIYKSIDGGATWTAQTSGTAAHIKSVFFITDQIGWVLTSSGLVRKTVNGGTTWSALATISAASDIEFISQTEGWAIGGNNILHTIDGGTTWTPQTSPVPGLSLSAISIVDNNRLYISGSNGYVLYTTDAGANWTAFQVDTDSAFRDIAVLSTGTGWIVNGYYKILKLTNFNEPLTFTDLDKNPNLNDKVLVKDQTDKEQNGSYIVSSISTYELILTRDTGFDESADIINAFSFTTKDGLTNAGKSYRTVCANPFVIGGDIDFIELSFLNDSAYNFLKDQDQSVLTTSDVTFNSVTSILSATSSLANGVTAATQALGNSSNLVATTSFVMSNILPAFASVMDDPTGFENLTDSIVSFVDGTRTLSIAPAIDDYSFYVKGIYYTKSALASIVITDVEGLHAIVYNNTGTLQHYAPNTWTAQDIIIDNAYICAIYWDATNKRGIVFEERHGHKMPSSVHQWLHRYANAQYAGGMQPAGFTIGDGSLASHVQFTITSGQLDDEDIRNNVTAITSSGADKDIYYIEANGNIRWFANQTAPVRTFDGTSATRLPYNPAGLGLLEAPDNSYVLMHEFALNNGKYAFVIGQQNYSTVNDARAGILTEASNLYYGAMEDLTAEFVLVSSVIYQTRNVYTNAYNARIVEVEAGVNFYDWRNQRISGNNGVSLSDHALLTNLQGGATGEYYHLTAAQYTTLSTIASTGLQGVLDAGSTAVKSGEISITSTESSITLNTVGANQWTQIFGHGVNGGVVLSSQGNIIMVNNSAIEISLNAGTTSGLTYNPTWTPTFVGNSLITKDYVDSNYASILTTPATYQQLGILQTTAGGAYQVGNVYYVGTKAEFNDVINNATGNVTVVLTNDIIFDDTTMTFACSKIQFLGAYQITFVTNPTIITNQNLEISFICKGIDGGPINLAFTHDNIGYSVTMNFLSFYAANVFFISNNNSVFTINYQSYRTSAYAQPSLTGTNTTANRIDWYSADVLHNNLENIQGGTTGEYFHLTQAQYLALSAGYVPNGDITEAIAITDPSNFGISIVASGPGLHLESDNYGVVIIGTDAGVSITASNGGLHLTSNDSPLDINSNAGVDWDVIGTLDIDTTQNFDVYAGGIAQIISVDNQYYTSSTGIVSISATTNNINLTAGGNIALQSSTYISLQATTGNYIAISTGAAGAALLEADNLTTHRTFQFPDASGTLALLSDIVGGTASRDQHKQYYKNFAAGTQLPNWSDTAPLMNDTSDYPTSLNGGYQGNFSGMRGGLYISENYNKIKIAGRLRMYNFSAGNPAPSGTSITFTLHLISTNSTNRSVITAPTFNVVTPRNLNQNEGVGANEAVSFVDEITLATPLTAGQLIGTSITCPLAWGIIGDIVFDVTFIKE